MAVAVKSLYSAMPEEDRAEWGVLQGQLFKSPPVCAEGWGAEDWNAWYAQQSRIRGMTDDIEYRYGVVAIKNEGF